MARENRSLREAGDAANKPSRMTPSYATLGLAPAPGTADGSDWPGPLISQAEYVAFAEALGLTIVQASSSSPFHHEIVAVEYADACRAAHQPLFHLHDETAR
ncbi:hypothetical protein WMF45_00900 [Sorangium sp. So ce448]|uniref:hypothetical protein n=1 Tax=Sorangium sp. So ce448 TaxID=3133314 RepID=UPI003F608179